MALGKAGNPETMDGIHPELVIGPSTEITSGNGMILTAGTVDTHVHFVGPDMLEEALAAGTTTVVGGGTGPTEGSKAIYRTRARDGSLDRPLDAVELARLRPRPPTCAWVGRPLKAVPFASGQNR